jgi:flagellar biosynthesis component FlhA
MSTEELFNELAKIYIERESLIHKIADGRDISLSEAEEMIEALIEDKVLLRFIKMLDRFFLVKGRRIEDSVKIVEAYRHRLNQFIDRTIGFKEYTTIIGLPREKLEKLLKEDVKKLLERGETFLLLEAQLSILLKWFRR